MLGLIFSSSRNHFHSSNREGCGHALVSFNIGSLDGQLTIEIATHSLLTSEVNSQTTLATINVR